MGAATTSLWNCGLKPALDAANRRTPFGAGATPECTDRQPLRRIHECVFTKARKKPALSERPLDRRIPHKIALIGFLGSDAEARTTKNGASYTVLSLATKRSWKNDRGDYESRTYWHRAVAWGKLATFAATLKKGVARSTGRELRTREYEKEYGNRFVILNEVKNLPSSSACAKSRWTRL